MTKQDAAVLLVHLYADYSVLCSKYGGRPDDGTEEDELLHHSRPLALAYLALTEDVDSVPIVRCKDCKHYDMGVCLKIYSDGSVHPAAWQKRKPEDFCSYGEQRDKPGCPRGQCGPLASCPVCGGFDTVWDPNTDESFCKSCGFSTRWI